MFKKIITLALVAIIAIGSASAKDKVTRDINQLPTAARSFIKKHFSSSPVSHIKIDSKAFGGANYDVILNNGTEIEFDKNGAWKEIDCGGYSVPSVLIMQPIRAYVQKNYKGKNIVKVEVDKNKYELRLSDGTELEFDRAGKFLRVDY